TSLVTSFMNARGNADGHSRAKSWTGAIAGGTAMLAGAFLQKSEMRDTFGGVGLATAAVGAMSFGLSVNAMNHHRQILSAERRAAATKSVAQATISPILTTDHKAGVNLSLRF